MFIAEIVAVDVDESLLDESGRLCLDRADLAAFAHGEYFALGEKLGKFGFSTKPERPKPEMHKDKKPFYEEIIKKKKGRGKK